VIRVLLADDQPLLLTGITHALESADGIEVAATEELVDRVPGLASRVAPDVVVLGVRGSPHSAFACLDELRRRAPRSKVLILADSDDPNDIRACFRRGAAGYVLTRIDPRDVPSAIRQAVEGTVFTIGNLDLGEGAISRTTGLTTREIEILKHVARGLSNDAIAKELWVTEQTVKFHLTNIYRKLGVHNRTEAARYAYEQGLVDSLAGSRSGAGPERASRAE
jgi:DNA-binding NarL/FixJ family response regulator